MKTHLPLGLRLVSVLLVPLHVLSLPSVRVWAATQPTAASDLPQIVKARAGQGAKQAPIQFNTKLPAEVEAAKGEQWRFSEPPQEHEFAIFRILPEPLLPVGRKPTTAENRELAAALTEFRKNPSAENAGVLTSFLERHSGSPWTATLQANLGLLYRGAGYWSKALSAWKAAWQAGSTERNPDCQLIIDRSVAGLAELLARLGRVDELEAFIKEVGDRDVRGPATEKFAQAKQSLHLMHTEPNKSFRCGPFAVGQIWSALHPGESYPQVVLDSTCTLNGTSLSQVQAFAAKLGFAMQMAKRSPGAEILTPAVVHWKEGHYAALIERQGDRYLVKDPTFGDDFLITQTALDQEASGAFLVLSKELPSGWSVMDTSEGAAIWGKGRVAPNSEPPPPCFTPGVKCPTGCSSPGMVTYDVDPARVNLTLKDTPLFYTPVRGGAIEFTAHYSSRDQAGMASPNYANLGPKWNLNVVSYIDDGTTTASPNTPAATVKLYGPGGGFLSFAMPTTSTAISSQEKYSQAFLVRTTPRTYELQFPNGSKRTYTDNRLATFIDPSGNQINYSYGLGGRLVAITDAVGKVTVLRYVSDTYPPQGTAAYSDFYRVREIELGDFGDGIGRKCSFTYYETTGQLWKITDSAGIVSEFFYEEGDFINRLRTPYGDTKFVKSDVGGDRKLDILGVDGEDVLWGERVWFKYEDASAVPDLGAPVPTAAGPLVGGQYWQYRNTYYWDKKAFAEAPDDFKSARLMHFLHRDVDTMSDLLESEKLPLESRVFYTYQGQTQAYFEPTTNKSGLVTKVARVLDGNEGTQVSEFAYNASGRVVKVVTPGNAATPSRVTTYQYAANGIDILAVYQRRAGGLSVDPEGQAADRLVSYTYNDPNAPRLPDTITSPSGYKTTYAYNTFGQLKSIKNAKDETTTFTYDRNLDGTPDPDGFLVSVVGHVPAAKVSFQYDAFGRIWTVTDSENYTVEVQYEAVDGLLNKTLNRPVKTIYPDGTYEQVHYSRLDPEWTRDRAGRWTWTYYNNQRQLAAIQDPLGRLTQFDWCGCGSLESIIDPEKNTTTFFRDIQGRVIDKVYPDNSFIHYDYQPKSGRLVSITDPKKQVTSLNYNIDGSLASVSYSNSAIATPGVSFTYDPAYGRIATMTDGVGQTIYTYKSIANPTQPDPAQLGAGRLQSIDGPWDNDTLAYTYDELGRVVTRDLNGAVNHSQFHYDALGRTDWITNALGQFTYKYVNATGQLDYIDYPNAQRIDFDYYSNVPTNGAGNGDRRLKQIRNLGVGASGTGPVLSQFDYAYNVAGKITEWTQSNNAAPNPLKWVLGYDEVGQLTSAKLTNVSTGVTNKETLYGFDPAGNRSVAQSEQVPRQTQSNELNQIKNDQPGGSFIVRGQLSEAASVTLEKLSGPGGSVLSSGVARLDPTNLQFSGQVPVQVGSNSLRVRAKDASNNESIRSFDVTIPTSVARDLAYDSNGNLREVKESGVVVRTYEWDAVNRLVAINEVDQNKRTELSYDGLSRWTKLVEKDLTGANQPLEKRFVWEGLAIAEERDSGNVAQRRYFSQGYEEIIADGALPSHLCYYTRDHLGSIREVTDAGGTVRARYSYDVYGQRTTDFEQLWAHQQTGTGQQTISDSGTYGVSFGFTGFYYHVPSGLQFAAFRAYDSSQGRWINRDPSGESGGLNLYAYAGGDPVNYVDPDGRFAHVVAILAVAVVASIILTIFVWQETRTHQVQKNCQVLWQTLTDSWTTRRYDPVGGGFGPGSSSDPTQGPAGGGFGESSTDDTGIAGAGFGAGGTVTGDGTVGGGYGNGAERTTADELVVHSDEGSRGGGFGGDIKRIVAEANQLPPLQRIEFIKRELGNITAQHPEFEAKLVYLANGGVAFMGAAHSIVIPPYGEASSGRHKDVLSVGPDGRYLRK